MAAKNSRTAAAKERQRVQVNLGSGAELLNHGFINVDAFIDIDSEHFRKADLRALPFEKESVDYVLANNVIEHLPMADVPVAIYEIRRILKTGGRAVIIVPDFSFLARAWLEMEQGGFHAVTHRWISEMVYGNQLHEGEYHRAPMSPSYLNYVLQMCGFTNYKMSMWPAGAVPPNQKDFPGFILLAPHNVIRNDMIIADITK